MDPDTKRMKIGVRMDEDKSKVILDLNKNKYGDTDKEKLYYIYCYLCMFKLYLNIRTRPVKNH